MLWLDSVELVLCAHNLKETGFSIGVHTEAVTISVVKARPPAGTADEEGFFDEISCSRHVWP